MFDLERYMSFFDPYFTYVTIYYIISTAWYFVLWFFKRPLADFIDEYSLNLKLQSCYWAGFGLMYMHYGFLYTNTFVRHEGILYVLQGIVTVIYIVLVFFPVVYKLRDMIPEHRSRR